MIQSFYANQFILSKRVSSVNWRSTSRLLRRITITLDIGVGVFELILVCQVNMNCYMCVKTKYRCVFESM